MRFILLLCSLALFLSRAPPLTFPKPPNPNLYFSSEEISQQRLNKLRGVANVERLDEELYHDFEDEGAKAKRLAKEAKDVEKAAKKGGEDAAGAKRRELAARSSAAAAKATKTFYRLTVRDNGMGMAHSAIPDLLGRVLSGTKYGVCQTRGKFGLGAKMALIWSKMSTGLPIDIRSARRNASQVSVYKLDIDIHRNEPNVHASSLEPNAAGWRGTEMSVIILGNWTYYRSKILRYLRQIAVITPYAQFKFAFVAGGDEGAARAGQGGPASPASISMTFARRTEAMPSPPAEVKHHPASVDLELVKRLAASTTAPTLPAFLAKEFACVSKAHAQRLVQEARLGAIAETDLPPKELTAPQAARLHQLLHEARFDDPSGEHLSPAGEYNLRLGITKEARPDLVATHAGEPRVLEGHAFAVEAAVSLGGRDIRPGINVYRFANRIPLLFEGGSDVITKTAMKRINWASYKINQSSDKVGVWVSVVSTKIPYKGAGKEYIADDMDDMVSAVRAAIQGCCAQLKVKIARAQAVREQKQRKRNLTKYVPDAANALFGVLDSMAEGDEEAAEAGGEAAPVIPPAGPKRRRLELLDNGGQMLRDVSSGKVTRDTLAAALTEHVERVDTDMALEFQMAKGLAAGGGSRCEAFLVPLAPRHAFGGEAQGVACALRLLLPA